MAKRLRSLTELLRRRAVHAQNLELRLTVGENLAGGEPLSTQTSFAGRIVSRRMSLRVNERQAAAFQNVYLGSYSNAKVRA